MRSIWLKIAAKLTPWPRPSFIWRAADRGAENVHGGEEIVAHLIDAPADRVEEADEDARRAGSSRCSVLASAASPTAPSRIAATRSGRRCAISAPAACAAAIRRSISQAPAVSMRLDAGEVEHQRADAVALLAISRISLSTCDDASRRPDAGQRAGQHAAVLADLDARCRAVAWRSPAACFAIRR